MKKAVILFGVFFLLISGAFFISKTKVNIADARSGCCSHHGGVDGCGCADGTPLSAKCLPYYPQCTNSGYQEPQYSTPSYSTPSYQEPVYTPPAPRPAPKPVESEDHLYKVAEVVDGDTIKVDILGEIKTVRIIGIDTPETVHPSKPVECFGKEASNNMKDLVLGKTVHLIKDGKSTYNDKYARLLRYVELNDGTDVGAEMIKNGYAYAYTTFDFDRIGEYKNKQSSAEYNKKGLWADNVCEDATTSTTTTKNQEGSDTREESLLENLSQSSEGVIKIIAKVAFWIIAALIFKQSIKGKKSK